MTRVAMALGEDQLLASVAQLIDALGLVSSYTAGIGEKIGERWAQIRLARLSATGKDVTCFGGQRLSVEGRFDTSEKFDAIYIPASARMHVRALGATARKNRPLIEWLAQQHAAGAVVAAVGDGIFPAADAGLLAGGRATTSRTLETYFSKRHPDVALDMELGVVAHNRVVTGGPIGCELQVIARLLQLAISPTVAEFLGEISEFDSPRRIVRFPTTPRALDDPLVAQARRWLRENALRGVTAVQLAAALDVNPRTLLRRFHRALGVSPHEFIESLRIDASKRLLLRTQFTVERIAVRVGYSNTNHFRAVFRRHVGILPAQYRQTYGD